MRSARFEPEPGELADRYAAARARILGIVSRLRPVDFDRPVPATPKWNVHGLLSHVIGVAVDVESDQLDGAPGEEWTDRQVATRQASSLLRLLEEWEHVAPRLDAALRAGRVHLRTVLDVLTHEGDLRAAVGMERIPDRSAVRFTADAFGGRAVHVAAKAGLRSLQLRGTDSDWRTGEGGGVIASAPEYEWIRALAGRRSADQIRRFEWSDDPTPYLDVLCPFGPLPAADIVE